MKKDVREEESFIFAIYIKRHNVNEVLLAVPLIFVIFFLMIGIPIIMVLCELPIVWLRNGISFNAFRDSDVDL